MARRDWNRDGIDGLRLAPVRKQAKIRYVDVLPALAKASESERIYIRSGADMHPNKNGYRVIAEVLSQNL